MHTDKENKLIIFTDGSSLGNPGPGGWGVLLAYPKLDELVELGGTKIITTNNEMELTAVVSALSYAINSQAHAEIYTDSKYVLNGVQEWMYTWASNGWTTTTKEEVKNKELWQTLYQLIESRGKETITWHHVRGHTGIPANERVDDIARELAGGTNVKLYRGTLSGYPLEGVLTLPSSDSKSSSQKGKKNGKAYVYLSLVKGEVRRHATWAECEAWTTGRSSKFKKALSPEHEQEILKEWGVNE